jgi:hypothetical protein
MASDHSTGTDRPAEVAYPNLGYSSAAGVREPDPPSYGKSPSETARRLGMTVRTTKPRTGVRGFK